MRPIPVVFSALALVIFAGCHAGDALHGGRIDSDDGYRYEDFFTKKPPKPADEAFALVDLTNRYATARVSLFGAQVVSYRPVGGSEVLFQPQSMPFSGMGEIHGGIPICWPSFSFDTADAGAQQHGFARYSLFRVDGRRQGDGYDEVTLALASNADTLRLWPHEFRLEVKVTLTDRLLVSVTTRNTGSAPFVFTEALHAYFRVADVRRCAVRGLSIVKGDGDPCVCAFRPAGACHGSVGASRPELVLEDEVEKRAVGICSFGNNSVVAWNPGDFGASKDNLVAGEWCRFLCVEPANVAERGTVTVAPGEVHEMQLSVVAK